MTPTHAGSRFLTGLVVLLAAAIALVVWLALRGDDASPPPDPAPPAERPSPAPPPKAPRHAVEPVPGLAPPTGARPADEPEEEEPRQIVVEVEVRGTDMLPARGAEVVLLDALAHHAGVARPSELARATTDDAGLATFSVSGGLLRAYAWLGSAAGATERFRASRASGRAVIALSDAIAVRGRVADPAEAGVAGAHVRLVAAPWFDDAFGLVLETRSAADGRFTLPSIPGTAFDVAPLGVSIEARAAGYPRARVPVRADDLRAGEVLVRVERGGVLRGRVLGANGLPLAGSVVRLLDGSGTEHAGADGRFELPLPPSGGKVLVTGPPALPRAPDPAAPPRRAAPRSLGFIAGDRGDVDAGDVTLSEGQPLQGQVVDLEERAVREADVELFLDGVPVASTRTDENGRFRFEGVAEEPHLLRATEPAGDGAWTGRRHADVREVRGGSPDVRVVLTGALTVFVRFVAEADRSPVVVPQVTLRAVATDAGSREQGWSWAGSGIDSVRFEVAHAGNYEVTVELPGYERASVTVGVLPDREAKIDVLFRRLP